MKEGDRYGREKSIPRQVRVQSQQCVLEAFQDSRPGDQSSINQPAVEVYSVRRRRAQNVKETRSDKGPRSQDFSPSFLFVICISNQIDSDNGEGV